MSQSTAVTVTRPAARPAARPATRTGARVPAQRLRVVSAPAQARSRAGLVVASLTLLAVGLVGLLLLNVNLEKGAFVRRTQQTQIDQLTEQRQALQEELAALEAPQSLASKAVKLGMVVAPNVAFVRANGQVFGESSPAVAKVPTIVTGRGSPALGQGAATGLLTGSPESAIGPALPAAGKAATPTKVTAAGRAAASTTSASSGKPASSATAAKTSASTPAATTARKGTTTSKPGTTKPVATAPATTKPATR
jgi:hypothetical protein